MTDLDAIRASRAACADLPWSCACVSGEQLDALIEELERMRGERAAVVAWLREVSERRFPRNEREQGIVFRLSHEVERGEHRREEKP